jgi:uncharacterized protein YlxW (UPF0749 family)
MDTDTALQGSSPAPRAQRAGTAGALALLALVLVVAARSEGADAGPRTGRRVELVELIRAEQQQTVQLEREVEELRARVTAFEEAGTADAAELEGLSKRIDALLAPAGMTPVRGPGVEVTLTDSALETSPSGDLNDLVIHEQDLQAVINALWAGGAEAMSVNDQRILATTAIRCVGNTLLLHGAVYSPPYVVRVIGDEVALRDALERDTVVAALRTAAAHYGLGFAVTPQAEMVLPAYAGASPIKIAEPAPRRAG